MNWRHDIEVVSARIHRWAERLPKPLRVVVAVLLICFGFLGFLPVLGFWMIPLGLMILSIDVPWITRQWHRVTDSWKARRARAGGACYTPPQIVTDRTAVPPAPSRRPGEGL